MKIHRFMFLCVVLLFAVNCVLAQANRSQSVENKKLIHDSNEIFERLMVMEAQNLGMMFHVMQLKAQNEELTRQVRWLDGTRSASR